MYAKLDVRGSIRSAGLRLTVGWRSLAFHPLPSLRGQRSACAPTDNFCKRVSKSRQLSKSMWGEFWTSAPCEASSSKLAQQNVPVSLPSIRQTRSKPNGGVLDI